MPTSEINRISKIIHKIAKENNQDYSSVQISTTTYGEDKTKVYSGYINDVAPWIKGNSIKELIENIKTHIKQTKLND